MIQITLTFATLNAALHALREIPENSLVVHTAAVSASEKAAVLEAPGKPSPATPARGPRTAKAEAPAPAAPEKTVDEAPAAAASAETAQSASTAVDYADLKKAVLKLNTANPAACQAVLAKLDTKSFKDLATDKWGQALDLVNEALAT